MSEVSRNREKILIVDDKDNMRRALIRLANKDFMEARFTEEEAKVDDDAAKKEIRRSRELHDRFAQEFADRYILEAANKNEAEKIIKLQGNQIAVVVTDMRMPRNSQDGQDVAELASAQGIEVIMVTGDVDKNIDTMRLSLIPKLTIIFDNNDSSLLVEEARDKNIETDVLLPEAAQQVDRMADIRKKVDRVLGGNRIALLGKPYDFDLMASLLRGALEKQRARPEGK